MATFHVMLTPISLFHHRVTGTLIKSALHLPQSEALYLHYSKIAELISMSATVPLVSPPALRGAKARRAYASLMFYFHLYF